MESVKDYIIKIYRDEYASGVNAWHQLPLSLTQIVENYILNTHYLGVVSESRQVSCVLYTMWKLNNYNHTGIW